MKLDVEALIEDTALARATLYRQHCELADDCPSAILALASQLLHQGEYVLISLYRGDTVKARAHCRLMFDLDSDQGINHHTP